MGGVALNHNREIRKLDEDILRKPMKFAANCAWVLFFALAVLVADHLGWLPW